MNDPADMISNAKQANLDERFSKIGDIKLINHKPTYLTVGNMVSRKLSSKLIALVDKRGESSKWEFNPNCMEYQIANPYSGIPLENDEEVADVFTDLFAVGEFLLRQINSMFINSAFDEITGHHGFWLLKYKEGGTFDVHCDTTNQGGIQPPVLATASILLNEQFEGGDIVLIDSRGAPFKVKQVIDSAVVWDGMTHHTVTPVTKGFRYVLIIHYVGKLK